MIAAGAGRLHLPVDGLDGLGEVGLDGVEGSDHGRRAEAVRDGGEMREMTLHCWVDERRQTGVTDRRPVLTQHVYQLLDDLPTNSTTQTVVLQLN